MTAQDLVRIREANNLTKSAFAAAIGITAMLEGRYEGGKLSIPDNIAEKVKAAFPDKSAEPEAAASPEEKKKTARKPRGKKETVVKAPAEAAPTPAVPDVVPARPPVEEKTATDVEEKAPVKKKTGKTENKPASSKATTKKSKAKAPEVVIESLMGGTITVDEILSRVPDGTESVYVKPEENRAYWVKGEETDSVDLW